MTRTPRDVLPSQAQGLGWPRLLERWRCSQCAIGVHWTCDVSGCKCGCHDDPWQPRKPRKCDCRQSDFPFDDRAGGALKLFSEQRNRSPPFELWDAKPIKPETPKNQRGQKQCE